MSYSPIPPTSPLNESCLLAEAVEYNMLHNADRSMFIYAKDDSSDAITSITFLEFGRACHRVAHAIRPNRSGPDHEVVAFIALTDTLQYHAITTGLVVAGLIPFPISPRNSPAAVVNLLQKTACHRLITTTVTLEPLIEGVRSFLSSNDPHFELKIEDIPTLDTIYPNLGVETIDHAFTFYPKPAKRPELTDVCLYLHSSGSTGFPKAIPIFQQTVFEWGKMPPIGCSGQAWNEGVPWNLAGMPLPPFHTLGIACQLFIPLFGLVTVGLYPPVVTSKDALPIVPSPDNILDHTVRTHATAVIIIPAIIQAWAASGAAVKVLQGMDFIGYSGGSLAPKTGNYLVSQGVNLRPMYGGTEFGAPSHVRQLPGDEKEWEYMRFDENVKIRWVPQGDGTFECQFLATKDHTPSILNLPDTRGYATSDLWERHPTKPHLWKIVGRVDDVIVHSSGEKTVPAPMEDIIMSSPIVNGVVIFGRERDLVGVLVEPKPGYQVDIHDPKQVADLRNKLMPIMEEVNQKVPKFSRIFKEMILFAAADKPLNRTGKGTVMKKAALQQYDEEIKALYDSVAGDQDSQPVDPPASWTEADLSKWLLAQATEIHSNKSLDPDADLFEQGFDSLSAAFLRNRAISALRARENAATENIAEKLTESVIYNNPTLNRLAALVARLVANPHSAVVQTDPKEEIKKMIEKYSSDFPTKARAGGALLEKATHDVVLLTGSTGNLGSQLLASMLQDPKVKKVYALNRPSSSSMKERHEDRFRDKELDVGLLDSEKLVFVEGETSQPNMGLNNSTYTELQESVNVIIHNAWRLDFNLSLASYEGNVRGTRNLIDFALSGPHASSLRFLFTSTVASAQSWDKSQGPFPEETVSDVSVAVGGGYGEGKYVTEHILLNSGLAFSSFRIGQISGGHPNGAWATSDWLPILVKSSLALGVLPDASGVVSWLPMDAVAQAVLDIAFTPETPPNALNLVHPSPVGWNSILSAIGDALVKQDVSSHKLELIPFRDWVTLVEKRADGANEQDIASIPAIKLIDFFRGISQADVPSDAESGGLAMFSNEKTQKFSKTIHDLRPVNEEDAERWVSYWVSKDFFE